MFRLLEHCRVHSTVSTTLCLSCHVKHASSMIWGMAVQDPRFQRALEEGRQRMQGPVPGEGSLASWLEQGRPPAPQPWGPSSAAFPLPQPEALYDQRLPEQSRMRESY